jgi:cytochrome P450
MTRKVAKARFEQWASSGEPVPLFREVSNLVMTLIFYILMGVEFGEKHREEVVPLVLAFEKALLQPQVKLLPRWMTKAGRTMIRAEDRMQALIREETTRRLGNMDTYQDNGDYFQQLIKSECSKFIDCMLRCLRR